MHIPQNNPMPTLLPKTWVNIELSDRMIHLPATGYEHLQEDFIAHIASGRTQDKVIICTACDGREYLIPLSEMHTVSLVSQANVLASTQLEACMNALYEKPENADDWNNDAG